jgi:hypothetical protein
MGTVNDTGTVLTHPWGDFNMMRISALAVLAALFAGTGASQAQFTIKLKERNEGEAALINRNEKTSTKVKVTDGMGNVLLDQNEVKTVIQEYKATTLKREAGKLATRTQHDYTKAQSGKADNLEAGPLQGKSVIIERTGDQFTFKYADGQRVEGAALDALTKDFSNKKESNSELEKLVLPPRPVKVGESWKIEMPKVVAALSDDGKMELDGAKATGQGTLVRAFKKNGVQFGEMKFKMEMPISTIGKDKEQLKFAVGAKIALDMTFEVCIDGTSEAGTLKMKMIMSGNATIPAAPGATATLDVRVDATQVQADAMKPAKER